VALVEMLTVVVRLVAQASLDVIQTVFVTTNITMLFQQDYLQKTVQ
jgi:hypothetical protein